MILTIIFALLMLAVFGKLLMFGLKVSWGLAKFVLFLVILPLALIGLVIWGLLHIALPLLIIFGIISLVMQRR